MKNCFGRFLQDRTCAYCHAATQELYHDCEKLNKAIIEANISLLKRKGELLSGCPHRHWVLGYDREEYWGCKAKHNGRYDDACIQCVLDVLEGE